ncbi:hypothetical protein DYB30_010052 [Aphanomyces astaci]|uniref:OTU domain-containing protein n=1 Tax=Aphanomyces astaci TaxID=112090 RepID=A0A397B4C0_APHAT|nr:hypothetical protein DYB36_004574 [Aphanomyces astaci]RHY36476.1 hypothetical protein DYB38_011757 [Aphanomyces astaci]RHY68194.1 hypothetical protein DYB30_010052 [Aphanomyces astaci]RHZ22316.1 hypothetical protein DYB31_010424 [Aphanomyces astaci]
MQKLDVSDEDAEAAPATAAAVADVGEKANAKLEKAQRKRDKKRQEERERLERIEFESQNVVSQRQIESDAIAAQLTSLGLIVKEIPSDGHCMYHAVADQLKLTRRLPFPSSDAYIPLRQKTAAYLRSHADDFVPFVELDYASDIAIQGLTHAPLRAALVSGAVKSDVGGRTYSTTTPPSPKLDDIKAHIAMMEQLTCNGCGIELQFDDIAKVGYCTEKALESLESVREISTSLICQRCFQIRNYGKVTDSRMPYDEYEKRVKALKPRDMLVVQLVDILDITGSLLGKYVHAFDDASSVEDFGIENVIGIRLISSVKGAGIPEVVSDIKDVDVSEVVPEAPTADADVAEEDIPEGDLISLKQRKQLAKKKTDVYTMTTSSLPGTTLAVSPIPITLGDESCNIFDTPGLIVNRKRQKLIEFLSKSSVDELNSILPGKKLPVVRSNNPKKPKRTTVLELVVPGFGWLGVTGIDMDGTQTLEKTLKSARIQISTCEGVEVHQRSALYPFEMTDTNKNLWKQN